MRAYAGIMASNKGKQYDLCGSKIESVRKRNLELGAQDIQRTEYSRFRFFKYFHIGRAHRTRTNDR